MSSLMGKLAPWLSHEVMTFGGKSSSRRLSVSRATACRVCPYVKLLGPRE